MIDGLVAAIYDAAIDSAALAGMMPKLASAFGASSCVLVVENASTMGARRFAHGTPPEMESDYAGHFRFGNIFLPAVAQMRVGTVAVASTLVPARRLHGSEYYNDYLLRYDVPNILAIKLWHDGDDLAMLNIMRGSQSPRFGNSHVRMGERLVPHFQRSIAIAGRLAACSIADDGSPASLDRLPGAVLLLDQRGRVLQANEASEVLLAQEDGLCIEGGRLAATSVGPALERAVGLAVCADPASRQGGAIAIPRPSGKRPFALLLTPLANRQDWLLPRRPAALAMLVDPENDARPAGRMLQDLYGLTRSEASVALGIAAGRELKNVADGLNLTVASARQYLTRAFHKTGTGRQHELTHLLAKLGTAPRG